MALITDKPEELKPENDLDNIPDDVLGLTPPQVIRLGNRNLFVMDKPPETYDYIKVEITMQARALLIEPKDEEGETRHVRIMRYIGAKLSVEPYKPAADEQPAPPDDDDPSLFDRDGQVPDDGIEPDADASDELADEAQAETGSGLDEFDPDFSHGATR